MSVVQAVIAVALLATVTLGGVQYINADTQARIQAASLAEAGFQALDSAFRARQAAGLPAPPAGSGPAAGGAEWEAALFPAFGAKPKAPAGLAWSYGADAGGAWFCLSGDAPRAVLRDALDRLAGRFPDGLYRVAGGCGGQAGSPGAVAATYWVVKASP